MSELPKLVALPYVVDLPVLYTYEEPEDVLETVSCPICYEPFVTPRKTHCCGKIICDVCLTRVTSCPLCRGFMHPLGEPSTSFKEILGSLKVKCVQCLQITHRGIFDFHQLEECPTDCEYGCGIKLVRKDLSKHSVLCSKKPVAKSFWSVGARFSIGKVSDWCIYSIEGDLAYYKSGPWGSHVSGSYNFVADRNYITKRHLQQWLDDGFCVYLD
eukprot:TRINITY_DN10617_c0_g1_i1.p1 TRINITY_DN10617_c0_g1~~TRINITY_DN10617_c0_g1_i1.p1  ORF type:complete len:214 (-),score=-10.23 TRINITY_DN10617_c0_g1_i1:75-716(-)